MWLYVRGPDQWFKVKSLFGCSDETVPRSKCALRHPPFPPPTRPSINHFRSSWPNDHPSHGTTSFNKSGSATVPYFPLVKFIMLGSTQPEDHPSPGTTNFSKVTTNVVVSHRTTLRIISNTGRYYTSHKPCALGQINIY